MVSMINLCSCQERFLVFLLIIIMQFIIPSTNKPYEHYLSCHDTTLYQSHQPESLDYIPSNLSRILLFLTPYRQAIMVHNSNVPQARSAHTPSPSALKCAASRMPAKRVPTPSSATNTLHFSTSLAKQWEKYTSLSRHLLNIKPC